MLFDFFLGRGVVPSFIALKRGKIETGNYEPDFPLRWMRKDLQLASASAYEQGVAMPLTNAAKELYGLAERYGLGEKDYSAIFAFLNAGRADE
jgi:3-hydroxyisobutyrate dehydrogenase/glyoxylate/succinic semialdehyde reductase